MVILMAPPPFRVYQELLEPRKPLVLLRFLEPRRLRLVPLPKWKVTMRPLWEMPLVPINSRVSPR